MNNASHRERELLKRKSERNEHKQKDNKNNNKMSKAKKAKKKIEHGGRRRLERNGKEKRGKNAI